MSICTAAPLASGAAAVVGVAALSPAAALSSWPALLAGPSSLLLLMETDMVAFVAWVTVAESLNDRWPGRLGAPLRGRPVARVRSIGVSPGRFPPGGDRIDVLAPGEKLQKRT